MSPDERARWVRFATDTLVRVEGIWREENIPLDTLAEALRARFEAINAGLASEAAAPLSGVVVTLPVQMHAANNN